MDNYRKLLDKLLILLPSNNLRITPEKSTETPKKVIMEIIQNAYQNL